MLSSSPPHLSPPVDPDPACSAVLIEYLCTFGKGGVHATHNRFTRLPRDPDLDRLPRGATGPVGDSHQRRCAASNVCRPSAAREHPDVIFLASDLPSIRPVPLVRDLRSASPQSRIIMIGPLLTPEEHRQLAELGLDGFFGWECITAEKIEHVIETVRSGSMRVVSSAVVEVWQHPERRRRPRYSDKLVLTPKLRAVLVGLAASLTQQQIADAERVGLRTIEERIALLKEMFGVPTTFLLGVAAERAGFVS